MKNNNYIISKSITNIFSKYIEIGEYKFQYENDNVISGKIKDKSIIIFGRFVNSHNYKDTDEDIINDLLKSVDVLDLIDKSKKLAGRFIIIFDYGEGLFIIPDATATIHASYTIKENELYISSNPKIIANINNWEESLTSRKIKSCAADIHPMPYDMTMYDEIKFVIPNHYLDCEKRNVKRYYPLEKVEDISVEKAAEITNKLLENISKGYNKRYKLSLPLTSGMDSRLILAIFKQKAKDIPMYTILLDDFNDKTPDIYIPKKITENYNLDYTILENLKIPNEINELYQKHLGSSFNKGIARNAWTYHQSKLEGHIFMSGDVIPLAKSNFGKNLPEFLATTSYLVAKTHNYSKENRREVKRWIKDIREYTNYSGVSKYDMFFWEHRFGKWASNSSINYDLVVDSITPFNCRELVETWLRIPRKERMHCKLHKKVIEDNWPELLDFPINPGEKHQILSNISILYYIGSMIKYVKGRNQY